jgi:uncharacterized 2Fe-2S/4Fe-4S cluster protein (DUF4445 family)
MTLIPCHYCQSEDVAIAEIAAHSAAVICFACEATGPSFDTRKTHQGMTAVQAAVKSYNERKAVTS